MSQSPLRILYWCSAMTLSVLGMIEGIVELSNGTIKEYCHDWRPLRLYIWFRLVLGIVQFPIHAFILMPARLSEEKAVTNAFTRDPQQFYYRINICNVALAVSTLCSAFVLAKLVQCNDSFGMNFASTTLTPLVVLESFSLCILASVLIARIVAISTDNVRQWFYLAWPSTPLSAAGATHVTMSPHS